MPPSPVYPSSIHNPEVYPRARLCGWSDQGDSKKDGEALRIHKEWIRHSPSKK